MQSSKEDQSDLTPEDKQYRIWALTNEVRNSVITGVELYAILEDLLDKASEAERELNALGETMHYMHSSWRLAGVMNTMEGRYDYISEGIEINYDLEGTEIHYG